MGLKQKRNGGIDLFEILSFHSLLAILACVCNVVPCLTSVATKCTLNCITSVLALPEGLGG